MNQVIQNEICADCQICIDICMFKAIGYASVNGSFKNIYINLDVCTGCRECEQVCPQGAIRIGKSLFDDDGWNDNDGDNNDKGTPTYSGGGNSETKKNLKRGEEAYNKILGDLENKKVEIRQVKRDGTNAVLTGIGTGLNANGIITSCLNFLKETNETQKLIQLGNKVGIAGIIVGSAQTLLAFTDGDISTSDLLGAVSLGLGASSTMMAFLPAFTVTAGTIGVISCVVGLASTIVDSQSNTNN